MATIMAESPPEGFKFVLCPHIPVQEDGTIEWGWPEFTKHRIATDAVLVLCPACEGVVQSDVMRGLFNDLTTVAGREMAKAIVTKGFTR